MLIFKPVHGLIVLMLCVLAATRCLLYLHLASCTKNFINESGSSVNKLQITTHTHTHTQEYKTHSDESDAQRIEQIIQRALQDVDWVVKKVSLTISIILS